MRRNENNGPSLLTFVFTAGYYRSKLHSAYLNGHIKIIVSGHRTRQKLIHELSPMSRTFDSKIFESNDESNIRLMNQIF